jgi:hypothetical protein
MRIAFLNRGREAFPGGDCVALDATMEALRRRGHVADEIGWVAEKLVDYDICHMIHCNFSWSFGNYEAIQKAKRPYVLTPVYYPGPLLSGITRNQMHEIVNNAAMVLPFSNKECSLYDWNHVFDSGKQATDLHKKWRPIPNGTDEMFDARDGREHMSTLDVITVSARGESDKNVSMVRKICERLNRSFTLATGLSRPELADIYKHHRVFVNASGSERMSLTIGEALCSGCRVLATQENWGNEFYNGLVTFDPADETRLELLIKWALTSEHWDYRPNAAARCITWDWVAQKLEEVYGEVLNG